MGAVPAGQRGAAAGMRGTFMNSGSALSIGIFFSLMIVGLAASLPHALTSGLEAQGVDPKYAVAAGALPPVGSLFAAFLGFNPLKTLLPPDALSHLSQQQRATVTGKEFFPHLISGPFHDGLVVVFVAAAVMMVVAAIASIVGDRRQDDRRHDAVALVEPEEVPASTA
jgi:hypothetical protein